MQPYPRTIDVDEIRRRARPPILGIYEYWNGKRCGRILPSRGDLDPVEMKQWLTGIQLVEVMENPRRLKYRLLGGDEIDLRGFNATGLSVEEGFICTSKEAAITNYDLAIDHKTVVFDWAKILHGAGFPIDQQIIFLPLSSNGADVDRVITYSVRLA